MTEGDELAAMVLTSPPQASVPPEIDVRPASSVEDLVMVMRIQHEAFNTKSPPPLELAAAQLEHDRREGQSQFYLASIGGTPVACGRATFTPVGVQLNGGATLPSARGCGAYRAVVLARWAEAVRRGTPALTTHANANSRPILERMGFREVGRIDELVDVSEASGDA